MCRCANVIMKGWMNRIVTVEECDATVDDSSNKGGKIKKILLEIGSNK